MLLRYLERATLQKATKVAQTNGTYTQTLTNEAIYNVQEQELTDEISASIYGANIYKMIRIKSVKHELEDYLYTKVNNKEDNISNYYIKINNRTYKVKSVSLKGIDLELI